jgi:hypothetical protein
MRNYATLIPELEEWNKISGLDNEAEEWIGFVGSFGHAIGYTTLFWPEFVVYEDCVFMAPFTDDRIISFLGGVALGCVSALVAQDQVGSDNLLAGQINIGIFPSHRNIQCPALDLSFHRSLLLVAPRHEDS